MFIAIIKRAGEMKDRVLYKGLPDFYPVTCVEGETREELEVLYPGAKVFTLEEYRGYAHGMELLFASVASTKPWWKFWGK